MRKIIITRKDGLLPSKVDSRIVSNNKMIGTFKAEDSLFEVLVSKSQQAIQAEIIGEDGRVYRSNAFFAGYGSKKIALYLSISGTKLVLSTK